MLKGKTELPNVSPKGNTKVAKIFKNLVLNAINYHKLTGRYLQIWGELGELYAEIEYGIKRHKPYTKGSDGKLGNDFVEIKTISPENDSGQVLVKRSGNFNRLLVIKVSDKFEFEGRFVERNKLSSGEGKYAKVKWVKLFSNKKEP